MVNYLELPPGENVPEVVNAIIEIPGESTNKYEYDKKLHVFRLDRNLHSPVHYPGDYGFIPSTLSDDGDPLDVLVVTPYPVVPGSVIRCRPVGVLNMTDEAGGDAKLVAVPHDKLSKLYTHVKEATDLPPLLLEQIKHFFENYKTLEAGKWVKVEGWADAAAAKAEIVKSIAAYKK